MNAQDRQGDARAPERPNEGDFNRAAPPGFGRRPDPRTEERLPAFVDTLRVLRQRAYVIVPIVLACTTAALVLAHLQRKSYTAWARLIVEPRRSHFISADAQGGIDSSSEVELRTQSLVVRSMPVARRVVRKLRLTEQGPLFDAWAGSRRPGRTGGGGSDYPEDRASEDLLGTITVDPVFRTRCLEVSCETTDPEWAARIANEFAESYVIENTQSRSRRLADAEAAYTMRYPEIDRKFQEAQAALIRFQEEHFVVSSAQPEATLRARETQLLKQLSDAQKERLEREAKLMQLRPENGAAASPRPGRSGHPEVRTARELAFAIGADDAWVRQLLDTRLRQASAVVELRKSFSDGHRELESAKARLLETDEELTRAAKSHVSRAESVYKAAVWKEEEVKRLLGEHRDNIRNLHQQIASYEALREKRDSLRALLHPIARAQAEMDLAASLDIANTRVIEHARPPDGPSKPRRLNYALAGLMVGLVLGAGAAYMVDALDETVRTPADVRRAVAFDTFGTVSVMSRQLAPRDADRALAMAKAPDSVASEQFRSLRTSILSSGVRAGAPLGPGEKDSSPGAVVLVTSPGLGEGKTTVSLNSAVAFAQLGHPVVMVDADLRRSSIHKLLGMSRSPGLVELLEDGADLKDVFRKVAAVPLAVGGLSVITAGRETSRPAELLSGPRFRELLEELRMSQSVIWMDSPPVMPVADARNLAPGADLVLVVVQAGSTRRKALERTCELLLGTETGTRGARLGVVINSVTPSVERQYGYSRYGYTYRSRESGSGSSEPAAGRKSPPSGVRRDESAPPV